MTQIIGFKISLRLSRNSSSDNNKNIVTVLGCVKTKSVNFMNSITRLPPVSPLFQNTAVVVHGSIKIELLAMTSDELAEQGRKSNHVK